MSSKLVLRHLRLVSTILAGTVITGCTQGHITKTALEFNKAMSDFQQKEILLNAVRASKGRSLQYSAVTGGNGNLSRQASVGSNISLVNAATQPFRFASMALNPNVSATKNHQLQISNLNSKEFIAKMQSDIPSSLYLTFRKRNLIDQETLNVMIIREIYITKHDYLSVYQAHKKRCRNARNAKPNEPELRRDIRLCDLIEQDVETLKTRLGAARSQNDDINRQLCEKKIPRIIKRQKSKNLWFPNYARHECDFLGFRVLFRMMRVLNLRVESGKETVSFKPEESEEWIKSSKYKSDIYKRKPSNLKIKNKVIFSKPLVFKLKAAEAQRIKELFKVSGGKTRVTLRSPQEMIDYLGQLIIAQTNPDPGKQYEPSVVKGIGHTEVALFRVTKGNPSQSVLSVVDEDGERFNIPRPKYHAEDADRSLRVIAFLNEIIALHTRREDLPATSTISVLQ